MKQYEHLHRISLHMPMVFHRSCSLRESIKATFPPTTESHRATHSHSMRNAREGLHHCPFSWENRAMFSSTTESHPATCYFRMRNVRGDVHRGSRWQRWATFPSLAYATRSPSRVSIGASCFVLEKPSEGWKFAMVESFGIWIYCDNAKQETKEQRCSWIKQNPTHD